MLHPSRMKLLHVMQQSSGDGQSLQSASKSNASKSWGCTLHAAGPESMTTALRPVHSGKQDFSQIYLDISIGVGAHDVFECELVSVVFPEAQVVVGEKRSLLIHREVSL